MTEEKRSHTESILENISLDDLERLVRGIEHSHITDLVKHSKHLQRYVFPGYRPDHLPWDQVPIKLARDAHNYPEAIDVLVKKWLATNCHLQERVKREVSSETIEDDIAKILASLDHDKAKRDRLLWALLLDQREEIRTALANGLQSALMNESSALTIKAERYKLAGEHEKAKQEISSLKNERDNLKEQNRKIATLQNEITTLTDAKAQVKAQHQEELTRLDAALQEIKCERDTAHKELDAARQERDKLQAELEQEQCRNSELQRSVDDLKTSLGVAIASQHENSGDVKRWLDEALKLLLALPQFDETWKKAVHALSSHLSSESYIHCPVDNHIQPSERWDDWQNWQQIESALVEPLLAMSTPAGHSLDNAKQAQKLLALRWYLLEWVKLSISERLLTDDSITDQVELGEG